MPKFIVDAHIPHGSGDAEYRIITSDGVIIAIVDPAMALDDPGAVADRIAAALNQNAGAIF